MTNIQINDKVQIIGDLNNPTHDIPIGHKSKVFSIIDIPYNREIKKGYKVKIKYYSDLDHYYFTFVFAEEIKKIDQNEKLEYNDECNIN